MTVETENGEYVVRHINRMVKPALVLMSEKHKGMRGNRIYIRENNLQYFN